MRDKTGIFFVLLLTLFSGKLLADLPEPYLEPGLNPYREQLQDADVQEYIDPFSGQLHRRYVDISIPGNGGLDLKVMRVYNNVQQSIMYRSTIGQGWNIHFGRIVGTAQAFTTLCTKPLPSTRAGSIFLERPDGNQEILYAADVSPYSSYLYVTPSRWKAICAGPNHGGLIVTSPEGIEYTMNVRFSTNSPPAWHTSKIRDRNGNEINVSYKTLTNSVKVIDKVTTSDGRLVEFFYTDETNSQYRLTSIVANGATWQYVQSPVPNVSNHYYLSEVIRPDNKRWVYTYHAPNSGPGQYSLKSVVQPTGVAWITRWLKSQDSCD
jgi:hypothetical protein